MLWVLTGLLSLTFLVTGASKLADVPGSVANFTRWGLSLRVMHAIGAAEVAGALGLLVPRLAPLAAAGLAATMCGAIRTGVVFREPMHVALPAALIAMLAAVVYLRRDPGAPLTARR